MAFASAATAISMISPTDQKPYYPGPRRRREDYDLGERIAVLEAVQDEHRSVFDRVSESLESLVRIEVENVAARERIQSHEIELGEIRALLPTLKITRSLVFSAALFLLSASALTAWNVIKEWKAAPITVGKSHDQ